MIRRYPTIYRDGEEGSLGLDERSAVEYVRLGVLRLGVVSRLGVGDNAITGLRI